MTTDDAGSSVDEQNRLLSQLLSLRPSHSTSKAISEGNDVLVQVSDQVPAGRGLVYLRNIQPGQVLLTLPADLLINVKSFRSFLHPDTLPNAIRVAGEAEKSKHPLSSAQLLSLLIARAKIESDLDLGSAGRSSSRDLSPKHEVLRLFVQTLPTTFDTVPLTWSLTARELAPSDTSASSPTNGASNKQPWKQPFYHSLLRALPRHSRALEQKVRLRFETDWSGIRRLCDSPDDADLLAEPALLASNPDLARSIVRSIDIDTFLWAWLCVNSRCVFLPLGLADHADNFTLAPMLDMANHTPDSNLECKVRYANDGGLELCAPTQEQHASTKVELGKATNVSLRMDRIRTKFCFRVWLCASSTAFFYSRRRLSRR